MHSIAPRSTCSINRSADLYDRIGLRPRQRDPDESPGIRHGEARRLGVAADHALSLSLAGQVFTERNKLARGI